MKQVFLLAFLTLLTGFRIVAQKNPVINLYAFSQQVLPGIRTGTILQENGNTIKKTPVEKINYFFYAELDKSSNIEITTIWIKGKEYTAKTEIISKTPVEITINDGNLQPEKITLVPASINKVVLIIPGEASRNNKKPSFKLKKLISSSELVVACQWKGKIYYAMTQKIKSLKPFVSV